MARVIWIAVGVAALLLPGSRASADRSLYENVNTIHELYRQCTSSEVLAVAMCAGFIDGVGATMFATDTLLRVQNYHFNLGWCSASGVTREQCGFNRSTQRIGQIVAPVFQSLASFVAAR